MKYLMVLLMLSGCISNTDESALKCEFECADCKDVKHVCKSDVKSKKIELKE